MRKFCPRCGREQSDEKIIVCERCKIPFEEPKEFVHHLAHDDIRLIAKELPRTWRFWKPLLVMVGLMVIANSLGIFAFWKKSKTMMHDARVTMTNLITAEFAEPRIRALVTEVARERATQLLAQDIHPTVSNFQAQVAQQLQHLQVSVDEFRQQATTNMSEFKGLSDFTLLVTKAQNDDREAFDHLVQLYKKQGATNDAFFTIAIGAVNEIVARLESEQYTLRALPPMRLNLDPASASEREYLVLYSRSVPVQRAVLLDSFVHQERFALVTRLKFLAEAIRNESSLRVLQKACSLVNERSQLAFNVLGWPDHLAWIEEWKKTNAVANPKP